MIKSLQIWSGLSGDPDQRMASKQDITAYKKCIYKINKEIVITVAIILQLRGSKYILRFING